MPFVPSKHLNLQDPGLSVRIEDDTLVVSAERAARFVWLRVPDCAVVFDDNYFDMAAGEVRRIKILRSDAKCELAQVEARSLWHSYQQ